MTATAALIQKTRLSKAYLGANLSNSLTSRSEFCKESKMVANRGFCDHLRLLVHSSFVPLNPGPPAAR